MAANEAAVQQQAMSPEERAYNLYLSCQCGDAEGPCVKCIAGAIRAAVAGEREACARLAEETGEHYESGDDDYLAWGWGHAQEAIASAIRSR